MKKIKSVLFGPHFKSSVAGYLTALAGFLVPYATMLMAGGEFNWNIVYIALGAAFLMRWYKPKEKEQ